MTAEAANSADPSNDTRTAIDLVPAVSTTARGASVASCGGCDARWNANTGLTHCANCHATFGSLSGFDAHRDGPIERRRCRTEAEMREKGYEPNPRGVWRRPMPAGPWSGAVA